MSLASGQRLAHYEILEPIGAGGMGEVYLARDGRLDREIALKVLTPELADDAGRRERFLREARAVAALEHPNITTIHDIGSADGKHFISFEYVEGQTLAELIAQGAMPDERAFAIALAVAEALDYAHSKGIVHRDLKPSNVMVSALGIPKLLDFGLAKVSGEASTSSEAATVDKLTRDGVVLGTVAYMSPEQALGKDVDRRSDVFSFGSLVYEMVSGRPAFGGPTTAEVLNAVVNGEPRWDDVPPDLAPVLAKALRKDRSERYQGMADVAADLRHVTRKAEPKRERDVPPERAKATPSGVAVMYFENLADRADTDNLGAMLTGLLTTELSRSRGLEIPSSQRLSDLAKQLGRSAEATVDRSVATEVAKRAGVATMVLGRVVRAGERMVVSTDLVEAESGRLIGSQKAEGKSIEDIFTVAEKLGEQVRSALEHQSSPSGDLARALTGSAEAYRAYVRGDVLSHRLDMDGAMENFKQAVDLDPEFALAHYRLSVAAWWRGMEELALGSSQRALALEERLPVPYRDLVAGNAQFLAGRYREAIGRLEATLAREPENKEALFLLGELFEHSCRDYDPWRAAQLLRKTLEVDPDYHMAYYCTALSHDFIGETSRAMQWLDTWEATQPHYVQELRTWITLARGDVREALRICPAAGTYFSNNQRGAVAILASDWDLARELVMKDPGPGWVGSFGLRNRGVFRAYRGQFEAAMESFHEAAALTRFERHDGLEAGVPATSHLARAELLVVKGELEPARAEAERALALQPENPMFSYYGGYLSALAGELDAAREYLKQIESLLQITRRAMGGVYRDALEGEIALAEGRPSEALPLFERATSNHLLLDHPTVLSGSGAPVRDGLALCYLALGDKDKAASALEALVESGMERANHPAIYVRALYRLGTLKLELGDEKAGRAYLESFLDHWGDADWELPEASDARALLT